MNNGIPAENSTEKIIRTTKGRAIPLKYTDRSPEIMKMIGEGEIAITNNIAFSLATEGLAEGTAIIGGDGTLLKDSMKEHFYLSDAKALNVSLILRPVMLAKKMMAIPAMASIAAARAIESISDLKISILWANELCYKGKHIATVRADSSILHDNFVGHIVLGVAFNIIPDYFTPRLSDIVAAVFNNQSHDVSERLTEAFVVKFFELYESYDSDRTFMREYKERSLLIGRRVKVRDESGRMTPARVCDVDNDARLIVETKDGERIAVTSRSEIIF